MKNSLALVRVKRLGRRPARPNRHHRNLRKEKVPNKQHRPKFEPWVVGVFAVPDPTTKCMPFRHTNHNDHNTMHRTRAVLYLAQSLADLHHDHQQQDLKLEEIHCLRHSNNSIADPNRHHSRNLRKEKVPNKQHRPKFEPWVVGSGVCAVPDPTTKCMPFRQTNH